MYQRTVLSVEDEFLIRMVLADTLAEEGYDVVEAETSPRSSLSLESGKSMPITDVDMPSGLPTAVLT